MPLIMGSASHGIKVWAVNNRPSLPLLNCAWGPTQRLAGQVLRIRVVIIVNFVLILWGFDFYFSPPSGHFDFFFCRTRNKSRIYVLSYFFFSKIFTES
jgi:hypothetical protein